MTNELDRDTREQLRTVLRYMVEGDCKSYWREPPEDRKTWAYHDARRLMETFDFEDLLDTDAYYRDLAAEVAGRSQG
jgi:hypothetical protein